MDATRYFTEQVLRKRPYIKPDWCQAVVANPLKREIQPNGRIRFWGAVPELGGRILRVVTLKDGKTLSQRSGDPAAGLRGAFPDRTFKP